VSLPRALEDAVAEALGEPVAGGERVSGGSLNEAWRVELSGGRVAFVKTSDDATRGSYSTEASGLRWLAEAGGLGVPDVLAVVDGDEPAPRLLALEWIDPGRLEAAGEEELGRGLAAVHAAGAPHFGSHGSLMLGPLELPGGPASTWSELYAECRLRPTARAAAQAGRLEPDAVDAVERVCERLGELAGPEEPPARVHGDLWSGNVLADADGRPHLIDPAAHGGQREVDLAMLRLFGGPGERCFDAYAEAAPLADGHAERVELWQLFPLLVHAALFGGSYGQAAARVAARYA
jgi:fructosamine-3-kinase